MSGVFGEDIVETPIDSEESDADLDTYLSALYGDMNPEHFVAVHGSNHRMASYGEQTIEAIKKRIKQLSVFRSLRGNTYVGINPTSRAEQVISRSGNPRVSAVRKAEFIPASKTFYADIDFGKKDGLQSAAELDAALAKAVQDGTLLAPTMVVNSGTGRHLYWIMDTWVPRAAWEPMAKQFLARLKAAGLHPDSTSTPDIARILRPPGTWHNKGPDGKPGTDNSRAKRVTLVSHSPHRYTLADMRRLLGVAALTVVLGSGAPGGAPSTSPGASSSAVGAMLASGAAALAQSGIVLPAQPQERSEFSEGIGAKPTPTPLEIVFKHCATLADVRARRGLGDSEPFWNLVLFAMAYYGEEGRQHAHALSDGYEGYDKDETDQKFNQKLAAIAAGSVGWPTCAAFAQHSQKCATCRFRQFIKSPLGVGRVGGDQLPPGYSRRVSTQGTSIWRTPTDEDDEPYEIMAADVGDAMIEQSDEGPVLSMDVMKPHCTPERLRLSAAAINVWREPAMRALAMVGIVVPKPLVSRVQEFFVSYLKMLQQVAAPVRQPEPFGWVGPIDKPQGFAVCGRIYVANGTSRILAMPGAAMTEIYAPRGSLDGWKDAAQFMIGSGRLDIQAMIATAFAGPLVPFTGLNGMVVSAFSPMSGAQKSCAVQVANAVWGSPKGIFAGSSTTNSVLHRLGMLRHLPVMWDEVKREFIDEKFTEIVFQFMQGVEKSRLTSDIQQRAQGTWATSLLISSNFSVQGLVAQASQNPDAAASRVFEIEVRPMPANSPALVSVTEANQTVAKVHDNYGRAGEVYAAYLAANAETLRSLLTRVARKFEQVVQVAPAERFWLLSATGIMAGAMLANKLSLTQFDLHGLFDYLAQRLAGQRKAKVDLLPSPDDPDYLAQVLLRFIAYARQKGGALETDVMAKRGLGVVNITMTASAQQQLRSPFLHIAHHDGVIRILPTELRRWLNDVERIPFTTVVSAMERVGMQRVRPTWAGGTPWAMGQVPCFEMNLRTSPIGRTVLNIGDSS